VSESDKRSFALADLQGRLVRERARAVAESSELMADRSRHDEAGAHQHRALGVRIACLDWTLDQLDEAVRSVASTAKGRPEVNDA
jgi:hypothetical protein